MAVLNNLILLLLPLVVIAQQSCKDDRMHPDLSTSDDMPMTNRAANVIDPLEETIQYWHSAATEHVSRKINIERTLNENKAKNIIMFLGDGMSLATVAATRMYMGNEKNSLSFEEFPHFGLTKTYCVDRQVADSACTATAYLHGVKANYGTLGVNAQVPRFNCSAEKDPATHTVSITKWAQDECKATGLVTTSRVTHASPAGLYAHSANRDWENDEKIREHCTDSDQLVDIARQLVGNDVGRELKVILGGGRREFRDRSTIDEEGKRGHRRDGRDLIDEWMTDRSKRGTARYVWNEQALNAVDFEQTDYLLGLFESEHCMYNGDIENKGLTEWEPSLTEMTEAAIRMLQKERNGYFLFVESARIDMAHHDTLARKALDETKEFSNAVAMARRMTNESDTLIIVTSDHAHTMTISGYPVRGNNILGLSGRISSTDGLPYTTLSYANGMGYYNTFEDGARKNVRSLNFTNPDLEYMSTVPRDGETHGGDDVGVYASGPWSHLFVGNYEQSSIPVAMAFAAKIGPYADEEDGKLCGSGAAIKKMLLTVLAINAIIIYLLN